MVSQPGERLLFFLGRWLHEDLSSRPYRWLRPDLVHLAPYLVCSANQTWMPFFRRDGRDPLTPVAFLDTMGNSLEQAGEIDLPTLTGDDLHSMVLVKRRLMEVLTVGAGMS